jgi:hypothetical protein
MPNANAIINDANYVPLVTETPDVLVTQDYDGDFIIVSTSLANPSGSFGKIRTWLKTPLRRVRR